MENLELMALAAQRAFSATIGRGAIALAVTGADAQAGSSEMAHAIAAAGASFGRRVLLVRGVAANADGREMEADLASVRANAVEDWSRLHCIDVPMGTALHSVLNDSKRLTAAFADWAREYDAIVVDCPPFGEAFPPLYTPLTASAADAVLMVATPGTTARSQFESVAQWLGESGAQLSALILNDRHNPTLAQEIVREANRLGRFLPWFPRFVARRVAYFPLLNRYR